MPRKVEKQTKRPLKRSEIVEILLELDVTAGAGGVKYAVIGGALFKMLGIEGCETPDIDVAATDYLDLPPMPTFDEAPSFCPHGHYNVRGVSVDWMPHGKRGSARLFQEAVKTAYMSDDGLWCARIEYAVAIKKWAGRPKDVALVNRLIRDGHVDGVEVDRLIKTFCGDENEKEKS